MAQIWTPFPEVSLYTFCGMMWTWQLDHASAWSRTLLPCSCIWPDGIDWSPGSQKKTQNIRSTLDSSFFSNPNKGWLKDILTKHVLGVTGGQQPVGSKKHLSQDREDEKEARAGHIHLEAGFWMISTFILIIIHHCSTSTVFHQILWCMWMHQTNQSHMRRNQSQMKGNLL